MLPDEGQFILRQWNFAHHLVGDPVRQTKLNPLGSAAAARPANGRPGNLGGQRPGKPAQARGVDGDHDNVIAEKRECPGGRRRQPRACQPRHVVEEPAVGHHQHHGAAVPERLLHLKRQDATDFLVHLLKFLEGFLQQRRRLIGRGGDTEILADVGLLGVVELILQPGDHGALLRPQRFAHLQAVQLLPACQGRLQLGTHLHAQWRLRKLKKQVIRPVGRQGDERLGRLAGHLVAMNLALGFGDFRPEVVTDYGDHQQREKHPHRLIKISEDIHKKMQYRRGPATAGQTPSDVARCDAETLCVHDATPQESRLPKEASPMRRQ